LIRRLALTFFSYLPLPPFPALWMETSMIHIFFLTFLAAYAPGCSAFFVLLRCVSSCPREVSSCASASSSLIGQDNHWSNCLRQQSVLITHGYLSFQHRVFPASIAVLFGWLLPLTISARHAVYVDYFFSARSVLPRRLTTRPGQVPAASHLVSSLQEVDVVSFDHTCSSLGSFIGFGCRRVASCFD